MTLETDKEANRAKSCPICSGQNGLREILYGLPEGPPDPNLYRLGGCCVSEDDPDWICVDCGWEGSMG